MKWKKVAFGVKELHLSFLDADFVYLVSGAKCTVDHRAGAHVLELGAHEGPSLSGLDVLELDDAVDRVLQGHRESVAEVGGVSHSFLW